MVSPVECTVLFLSHPRCLCTTLRCPGGNTFTVLLQTEQVPQWCKKMADHRITEWLRLKGTSGGHLPHPHLTQTGTATATCAGPCPDRFCVSSRTAFLGNLCQGLVNPTLKKSFLILEGISYVSFGDYFGLLTGHE